MEYLEISIDVAGCDGERAVDALVSEGLAVELRDQTTLLPPGPGRARLIAWAAPDQAEACRARIDEALRDAGIAFALAATARDEAGWRDAWKAHFHPRPVGAFVIAPSWEPYLPPPGGGAPIVLSLDPGRAFGTGGHASTRLCLVALGRVERAARFLDVGCGSGILAIAVARRFPEALGIAVDVDPDAVEVTIENAEKNDVADRVAARATPLEEIPDRFDLVLANLSAETLALLAAPLAGRVAPGGRLVAGGILAEQADRVVEAFAALGLRPLAVFEEDEWRAIVFAGEEG